MSFPVCEIDDAFHRLIPSRFPPVPLYERLGSREVQAAAEACEAKTNPRLHALERLAQEGPASPGGARAQNWNLAPFSYVNPEGTTYLDGSYKVLELVADARTALAVAVLRREAFLGGSEEAPLQIEMRALVHKVSGRFYDLTRDPFEADLETRRALGASLYRGAPEEVQGLLHPRPDIGAARGLTVFDGRALGAATQTDHYRFLWDGKVITQIGNLTTDEVISRDALFKSVGLLAAA